MKTKTFLLMLMITSFTFGQEKNSDVSKINCPEPISNNHIHTKYTIYLLGGIVSAITQKEIDFSKKYSVTFHDFGCLAPVNLARYELHNQKIFELLLIQFGPKWVTELKETTLGFEKWKSNNQ